MREIKFRAWYPDRKVMTEGFDLMHLLITAHNATNREFKESIEGVEIMQFTGLHDKNGKEIFEGDIVRRNAGSWPEIGKVHYQDCSFVLDRINEKNCEWIEWPAEYFSDCEVLGNIYENPTLLSTTQKGS